MQSVGFDVHRSLSKLLGRLKIELYHLDLQSPMAPPAPTLKNNVVNHSTRHFI